MSLTVKESNSFSSNATIQGVVYWLWGLLTRHVATTFTFELIPHILTIPILSPFLFIPFLHAKFQIRRIYYLLVSFHFYTHSVLIIEWGASPYKYTYSMNRYGVTEAGGHHGNAEIHLCTNFTTMVCKFEKWRSSYKEKCPRQFFVHGCHGNGKIHMRTKFHFHTLHGLQVWEVKK